MKKTILLLCFLLVLNLFSLENFAAQNSLQPRLAISPPRIEMQPEEKASESITVLNLGDTAMQIEVNVQNWDLDENNKFRPLPPTEQSLDQWLIINPVRLEIPAKSQQTVRLAVRPRTIPDSGEHRAMIFFAEQADPNKKGQINFRVGVPVYANFGEIQRRADLHNVSFDASKSQFVFDISNTGNMYVRPEGKFIVMPAADVESDADLLVLLKNYSGNTKIPNSLASGKLAAQPVLAQQTRKVTNKITIPTQDESLKAYVVAVSVDVADTSVEKVFRVN